MADAERERKDADSHSDKTVPAFPKAGGDAGPSKGPPPTVPPSARTIEDFSRAATVPKSPPPPPKPGAKTPSTAGNFDVTVQEPAPRSGKPAKDSTRGNFAKTLQGTAKPGARKPSTAGNFDKTIQEPAPVGRSSKSSSKGDYSKTIQDVVRSADLPKTIQDNWGQTIVDAADVSMSLKSAGQGVRSPTQSVSVKPRVVTKVDAADADRGAALKPSTADYELLAVLGEGGMGVVYTARQTSVDRTIAVKMIKGEAAGQVTSRNKFLAEAAVTADLDHPNIVPVYDLGSNAEGAIFYAMKKVKGKPWCDVIQEKDLGENLEILLRVCDAVAFAHDKGVVHRDLKPENVMLGDYGESLVMDWGLAGAVSDTAKADRITATNACCGTPCYMAPEMALGLAARIGKPSDIYLLGAILFEIVTGKPPHGGEDVMSCLMNAGTNEIIETPVKGEIMDIALKAMATEPEDRYGTVMEFQQAIRQYQEHFESTTLSNRAREGLERAQESGNYDDYAKSLYGFQEALSLWSGNDEARAGEIETRRLYAEAAMANEDFSQAEALLLADEPSHADLRKRVSKAVKEQQERARRMKRQGVIIKVGLAAIVIIIGVALVAVTISLQKAKASAEAARNNLKLAKQNEALAKKNAVEAEANAAEARREKEAADKARAAAEQDRQRAEDAKKQTDIALRRAQEALAAQKKAEAERKAAEQEKLKTEARIRYKLETQKNAWWVKTAAAAKAMQAAAAAELGKPVQLRVQLPAEQALEFVLIPAGEFGMGSGFEEPDRQGEEYLHRVRITRSFYLARYELSRGQWKALMKSLPKSDDPEAEKTLTDRHPVTRVSWTEVSAKLLPALQKLAPAGYEVRLPSEAQWEYACRAGANTAFNSGNKVADLERSGWFAANSGGKKLHAVGGKAPNAWGLYDMHGNAAEFCADVYDYRFYRRDLEKPVDDPLCAPGADAEAAKHRVYRGGAMISTAAMCRCAYRSWVHVDNHHGFIGVRLALVPRQ